MQWLYMIFRSPSKIGPAVASSTDEREQEQHDKNKEQDLRNGSGSGCDAKESEDPGDHGYYQKDYCPA